MQKQITGKNKLNQNVEDFQKQCDKLINLAMGLEMAKSYTFNIIQKQLFNKKMYTCKIVLSAALLIS